MNPIEPTSPDSDRLFVTKKVLAQRYGVCPRTIQNWSDAGLLVFIKKRRVVRYHVPGCDAALMQNGLQLN
jgi:hypothetical protein